MKDTSEIKETLLEDVNSLLKMEKKVYKDGRLLEIFSFDVNYGMKEDIILVSTENNDIEFKWSIFKSSKYQMKLDLNLILKGDNIPIFRIDFKASHTNPTFANEDVPADLAKYKNQKFNNMTHIHVYVKGYELKWAYPISDNKFPIEDIDNNKIMDSFVKAIEQFGYIINLKTKLLLNKCLL